MHTLPAAYTVDVAPVNDIFDENSFTLLIIRNELDAFSISL